MAAALSLGIAGEATGVELAYRGSLEIEMATVSANSGGVFVSEFASASIAGQGTVLANDSGAPGHLTQLRIEGGAFSGVTGIPATDIFFFPFAGLQVTVANSAGVFSGSGNAGFGGVMPLNGVAKVCLFGTCDAAAVLNVSVPLSVVGIGGSAFVTGPLNLTVQGAPWTTGTATVQVPKSRGGTETFTRMGSANPNSATADAGGAVTLVTPVFIVSNSAYLRFLPSFAIFHLEFIPEPDPALAGVIAAGAVGLVALGRSRRKR
jgi:hypothetical protein